MTYCLQCGDVDDDDLTPKRCDCYCPECNENVWPTGVCTYCPRDIDVRTYGLEGADV